MYHDESMIYPNLSHEIPIFSLGNLAEHLGPNLEEDERTSSLEPSGVGGSQGCTMQCPEDVIFFVLSKFYITFMCHTYFIYIYIYI